MRIVIRNPHTFATDQQQWSVVAFDRVLGRIIILAWNLYISAERSREQVQLHVNFASHHLRFTDRHLGVQTVRGQRRRWQI